MLQRFLNFILLMSFTIYPALASSAEEVIEKKTIRLVTSDWPPYASPNLPYNGSHGELLTEAFERAGYQVTIDFLPWKHVVDSVKMGKHDAAFSAFYSKKRDQNLILSRPIGYSEIVLFQNTGSNNNYNKLANLKGFTIGVVDGYVNSNEFDDADFLNKKAFINDQVLLKNLLSKKIDFAVMDKLTAQHLMKTVYPSHSSTIQVLRPKLGRKHLYVMFTKNNSKLSKVITEFNTEIEQMLKDGSHARIVNQYN